MLVVGLTGGIGAGKSTLAALLAEEGARVIDADALGREALQPGRPAWHSVVDQFGDEILAANSMDIDRKRLAAVVFDDPRKLAALNAIVHPVIFKGIADKLEELRSTDEVVVLDAALILEAGLESVLDVIVVVDSNKSERRDRLVRNRGMTEGQIEARMASQASREKLLERADIVVRNDGTLEELAKDARRLWKEVIARQ